MTELSKYIRTINDFPKPGIGFKDITTLTRDHHGFKLSIDLMMEKLSNIDVDLILGIESRGFIFGAALADRLGVGLDLIRKKGKLPFDTIIREHDLEYGRGALEIHIDSVKKGERVLIIDDVLATGGTAEAAAELVEELGGDIVGLGFLLELPLGGREKLQKYNVQSLISY